MPARLFEELRAIGAKTRLHICGNTRKILGGIGPLGADIGNLDPVRALRDGTPESVLARLGSAIGTRASGLLWGRVVRFLAGLRLKMFVPLRSRHTWQAEAYPTTA